MPSSSSTPVPPSVALPDPVVAVWGDLSPSQREALAGAWRVHAVLAEALAAVARADTLEGRLQASVDGMQRLGYAAVAVVLVSATGGAERVIAAEGTAARVDRVLAQARPTTWDAPWDPVAPAVSVLLVAVGPRPVARLLVVREGSALLPGADAAMRPLADLAAQAIRDARALEATERRVARSQRLHEVGERLARTLDEREVLSELARQVQQVLACRGVVVAHPDLEAGQLRIGVHREGGAERLREPGPLSEGLLAEVARTGRPSRLGAVGTAEVPAAVVQDLSAGDPVPVGSALAVPLRSGSTPLGVLAVYAAARQAFTADDEEVLAAIADVAAVALVNARSYGESQRERRQSEALTEIARAVGASLQPVEVLRLIQRHARALLHAEGAAVMLREGRDLHVVSASGTGDRLPGMYVPLDASLAGRAVRSGAWVVSNDVLADAGSYAPMRDVAPIRRTVIAPLLTATEVIGCLAVFDRSTPFTEDDARVLQRLADQVAVAIVNARLFAASSAATRELALVFDAIAAGLVVVDADGRIVRANPRAAELLGAPDAVALVGTSLPERLLGSAASPDGWPLEAVLHEGTAQRAIVTHAEQDRRYDTVLSPHPQGGAIVFFDDVTEEQAAATALARAEARYARLVEAAVDAIFTVDEAGHLTAVNPSLERALGIPREALLGRPVTEVVDPRDRAAARAMLADALRGEHVRREVRYRRADGVEAIGVVTAAPVLDGSRVLGAIGIVREVTEERALMAELVRQERLAALGQLVSGVAHELSSPLTGIGAHAQLLLGGLGEDTGHRETVRVIATEATRATGIVRQLLSFVRQGELARVPVDLNAVVRDTVALRAYLLRVQDITLELALADDLPPVLGDPGPLQQVLVNLLSNAEHAVREAGASARRITVSTVRVEDAVRVQVQDRGPGIPAERLERIFHPFFTTKPRGEGTGLGLPIADAIAREHGGRLSVSSVPAEGTTFALELPLSVHEGG
jgi:PAS domain S-box-containing protein